MRLPRVLLDGHQHSGEGPSEAGSVLAPASSPPSTFLHPSSPFFNPSHIIHTSQGFRAFPWTGISILVKDHLKLGPAAAQLMTSTAYMPWSVKPLYGGGRRIPYIIIANALSLLSWLALAFVPSLAASAAPFTLLLVLQNVGAAMADVVIDAMPEKRHSLGALQAASPAPFTLLLVLRNLEAAMADVVIDAMVAEAAKGEKERYAGDLQSLSWFSMAAGGVVGSLLGGPALKTLQPHGIESEESGELGEWEKVVPEQVVPEQQEEESVEGKGKEMGSDLFEPSRGKADEKSLEAVGARKKDGEGKEGDEVGGGKEEGGGEKSVAGEQSTGLRQRRGREGGDGEGGKGNAAETGRAEGAEEARKRRSEERSRRKAAGGLGRKVLDLVTALWHAVMSPDIFWPMAWFMTSCAVMPTLTSSLFYFHTNHLHLYLLTNHFQPHPSSLCLHLVPTLTSSLFCFHTNHLHLDPSLRTISNPIRLPSASTVLPSPTFPQAHGMVHDVLPMAWFMTSCAVVPTLTSSLFYFHTNHLHLDPSFLGSTKVMILCLPLQSHSPTPPSPNPLPATPPFSHTPFPTCSFMAPTSPSSLPKVIGWAGLMLGTLLYNTRLKYVPIRRIFMWVHISMAVCTIADTLLTSRLNLRLGIPDTVFLLGSAAVSDAVNQFKSSCWTQLLFPSSLHYPSNFMPFCPSRAVTVPLPLPPYLHPVKSHPGSCHSSCSLSAPLNPPLSSFAPSNPPSLHLPFRFMPFLVLSARLCPPGIEGTLFALFMSAYNFGNTLSGYMGATLATRLGITATSFDNLTLGVTIQAVCTLLPILFLRCVPANMTGVGDEGKQSVRVVEEQREDEVSRKHTGSKRPKKHE
ncbi:unnamed protein product [Closterium sp. NIES-65]|nr:unnamed protein product [Closterium sp. NIES-65]